MGITGTIVDFGLMNTLVLFLDMPLVWAQGISFTTAVFNNFLWNRLWTYPESRNRGAPKQLLQFGLINVIGILIRTPLITWVNNFLLRIFDNSSLTLPISNYIISQNLALATSIVIVLFWNFFANRYWTFRDIPIGSVGSINSPNHTINDTLKVED